MTARGFNEESKVQTPLSLSKTSSFLARSLSRVENTLRDTGDYLDWETIKRLPHRLKQKTKLVSYTVDEEFDALHEQFCSKMKALRLLASYTTTYIEQVKGLLQHSKEVAAAAGELFDPCFSLPHETKIELRTKMKKVGLKSLDEVFPSTEAKALFQEEYRVWDDTRVYSATVDNIELAIMSELARLDTTVSEKVALVVKYSASIEKHIRTRSHVLLDYDRAYDTVDGLALKQKTAELTVKQGRQYYHAERKLGPLQEAYARINTLLKEELPYFFRLAAALIQQLHVLTYYVNLMVTYQFSSNLLGLREEFDICVEQLQCADFEALLVNDTAQKTLLAVAKLERLGITQFRKSYLESLTRSLTLPMSCVVSNYDPVAQYCKAIFNFKGVEPGDLPFDKGDIIKVFDDSGSWWRGQIGEQKGSFPSNYVERCL